MKRANVGLWILVLSLVTGIFPIAASTAVAAGMDPVNWSAIY